LELGRMGFCSSRSFLGSVVVQYVSADDKLLTAGRVWVVAAQHQSRTGYKVQPKAKELRSQERN
jgi:hypothetical protein